MRDSHPDPVNHRRLYFYRMKSNRSVYSILLIGIALLTLCSWTLVQAQLPSGESALTYDSVPGDPLRARIYTLDNGLKVYLSVYRDEPRFQSMIGVKAGSKHDPAEYTGLAHYLEHMLFKGTDVYGTMDYEQEAPLLDTIFSLYERYGATDDSLRRAVIYKQIDSVSSVASRFAIANEFDKMMASMGVSGVNAYTSNERTVYINSVPANQLENFLTVEAERFRNPVMRLFHTELETVYEEKNRSLDNDRSKVFENLYGGLFPNHQYGTQTTIGTVEHLKKPSLKAIREYFDRYYVPNNMVIALSGDIDPDEAIRIISDRFGKMKPKEIPAFKVAQEKLIKQPVVREVVGPDAESVTMGFRMKGAGSEEADLLLMVDYILSNGQAGLLDLNLNKKQKVLSSTSSVNIMKDYSVHTLSGRPREGQRLEDVRDLILQQIMEIKLGNFPDWLLPAIVTNLRLEQQQQFESNMRRASAMMDVEMLGVPYREAVNRLDRLSKINKQQVIDFVRSWYGENYVIVYKRTGVDENVVKVVKPPITPVSINRDQQSGFVRAVVSKTIDPLEPAFLDFNQDIQRASVKGKVPVFMTANKENDLFVLSYTVETGSAQDKRWPIVMQLLNFMGTDQLSSSALQEEFYKLGCSFSGSASEDELRITLSGLQQHFYDATSLLEQLLFNPQASQESLDNLVKDLLKRRADARLSKGEILSRLTAYARYGSVNPYTFQLSQDELKKLTVNELLVLLRNFSGMEHRVDYYGPADSVVVVQSLTKLHRIPRGLQAVKAPRVFEEQSTVDSVVFFVHYPMKQAELNFLSKGEAFDLKMQPIVQLYNRYFGGGMSSPVFQTMRESRALAYAVNSRYSVPNRPDRSFYNTAYIGTQADKLPEALSGMFGLLTDMPVSEQNFGQSREGVLQSIRSERLTKVEVLSTFHAMRRMGAVYDWRKDLYNEALKSTLDDIVRFQLSTLKGRPFRIALIGDREKIDFAALEKVGKVRELTIDEIFEK